MTAKILSFERPAERQSFAHLAWPQLRLVGKACPDVANAGRFEIHVLVMGEDGRNTAYRPRPDGTYSQVEVIDLFTRATEVLCALED